MADCTPDTLLAHADHLDHAAARGGAVLPDGSRLVLDQTRRELWAADAALFRQHALEHMQAASDE
jgi:hypothetical protein